MAATRLSGSWNSYVALKLLSSDCYGTEHDIFEVEILKTITRHQTCVGGTKSTHVVELLDTFQIIGATGVHKCIAMPVLGCSLSAQAGRFPDGRIPHRIVKQITKQLLSGLAFLHDTCGVIHTPSNICFEVDQAQLLLMADGQTAEQVTSTISEGDIGSVRIIDLGVASWIDHHLSDNIQPEHLRAPEVILGAPWGPPVDIWSLGCLVIEFVKGHVAFNGAASQHGSWTSEDDHLAQYMEVLGPMPPKLLQRGTKSAEYFDPSGMSCADTSPENSTANSFSLSGKLVRIPELQTTSLSDFVDGAEGPFQRPPDMSTEEATKFVDFLSGALALDPHCRGQATELLQHEWLQEWNTARA
ncbi:hypothetical protein LTR86_010721 [Recurvomyces mirabilis]|nr:hypothetical protein LTR86_010721 [Recurvomyces mirabilis]